MKKKILILGLLLSSLFSFSQENYGTIIISEVYFDTRYNENINDRYHHVGEFIELYNSSNQTINIDRWKIKDGHTELEFREAIIEPGKFLLVAYNGGWEYQFSRQKLIEFFPEIEDYGSLNSCNNSCIYMQNSFVLYNKTDKVSLYDSNETLQSSIVYLNNPSMSPQQRLNTLNYLGVTEFDCEVDIDNGDGGVFNGEINDAYTMSLQRNSPSDFYTNGEANPTIIVDEATPFSIPFELPLLPLNPNTSVSPTVSKNYIHEIVYQEPYTEVEAQSDIPVDKTIQVIDYYDGLGRTIQKKTIAASPSRKDLVVYYDYDEYGRKSKEYLPYPSTQSFLGVFESNAQSNVLNYYQNTYNQDNPYSETAFENSSKDRIVEQGFPGETWKINPTSDSDHTMKYEYMFNTNSSGEFSVKKFGVLHSFGNIESPTLYDNNEFYPANELFLAITKNENWTSGKNHTTEEYKDREGNSILTRTFNDGQVLETYQVFDQYNNLTYVITPKVIVSDGISPDELDQLCFQYTYDNQFRVVEKKIPGRDREYTIYDILDRPVLTQDANQRETSPNEWNFVKYDIFGRVVYSGTYKNNDSRVALQNLITSGITNETIGLHEMRTTSSTVISSDPSTTLYYSSNAFPNSGNIAVNSIKYYDNYNFDIPSELNNPVTVFGQKTSNSINNLDTGGKVRVLGTNNWITSTIYYDYKSRPVYTGLKNEYLNYVTINKSKLDFLGRVLESQNYHKKGTNIPIVCDNFYSYDHFGRLLSQNKSINGGQQSNLFKNQYDDIGKLVEEKIASDTQSTFVSNNEVGVTSVGNYILKTNSNSWSNAAFTSDNTISGNGYVEFSMNSTSKSAMIGLSNPNTEVVYTSIKYAIYANSGSLRTRHNGVTTSHGTYSVNDRLRVERVGNKILYKKNNVVFHEKTENDLSNLIVDACLYHEGTQINNIIFNSSGLQTIDYKYNIRDWMTNINDVDNLNGDLFALKMNYDQTDYTSSQPLFNGRIAEILWNTSSVDPSTGEQKIKRAYTYQYDALNRLTKGEFKKQSGVNHNNFYNLNEVIYDKNGNISSLKRSGVDPSSGSFLSLMDDLNYTYTGNQLTDILEDGNHYVGFADKTNIQTGDYEYDSNGNLTKDFNKDMTIDYNYLNLPTKVDFGSLGYIEYKYSADGYKIEKKIVSGGSSEIISYNSGFIYKNGSLEFLPHKKGYIIQDGINYNYIYQLKDQLGSVRISFSDDNNDGFVLSNEIIQENNFYPFGLKHSGYNSSISSSGSSIANQYKFNGKELEESFDLLTYDFGARNFDPSIARWSNIDKLSEKYKGLSPYTYAVNNPVSFIDPDGNLPQEIARDIRGGIANMYDQRGKRMAYQQAYKEYQASAGWETGQIDPPWTKTGMSQSEFMAAMNNPGDYGAMMRAYSGPGKAMYQNALGYVSSQSERYNYTGNLTAEDFLEIVTGSQDWVDGTMALIEGEYGEAAKHYAWGSSGLLFRGAPVVWRGGKRIFRNIRKAKEAVPDGRYYSVAFEMELSPNSYPGVSRAKHFKEANIALDEVIESDKKFANMMSDLDIEIPRSPVRGNIQGKSPSGWVWHHDTGEGIMQLVPKSQHPNIPGGIFWDTMHQAPRRGGGYSIWGNLK